MSTPSDLDFEDFLGLSLLPFDPLDWRDLFDRRACWVDESLWSISSSKICSRVRSFFWLRWNSKSFSRSRSSPFSEVTLKFRFLKFWSKNFTSGGKFLQTMTSGPLRIARFFLADFVPEDSHIALALGWSGWDSSWSRPGRLWDSPSWRRRPPIESCSDRIRDRRFVARDHRIRPIGSRYFPRPFFLGATPNFRLVRHFRTIFDLSRHTSSEISWFFPRPTFPSTFTSTWSVQVWSSKVPRSSNFLRRWIRRAIFCSRTRRRGSILE